MPIRTYRPEDLEALRRIHAAQGFDYAAPDLEDPRFVVRLVGENENGEVVMALFLRLTAEAYLLVDRDAGTPQDRWRRFLGLHEMARRSAKRLGLQDVNCWVPPGMTASRAFARRLRELGWTEDRWRNFTFRLEE